MNKGRHLPGSDVSSPGGPCADSGPGVLPEPGDLTSSFRAPYDNDELGGLCKRKKREIIIDGFINIGFKGVCFLSFYIIICIEFGDKVSNQAQ